MNKLAKLGLLASTSYVVWSYGALAQQIPSFPNATTPFTGAEQTYLVQGGASKNMTLNQLATWAGPTTLNTTTLRNSCTSATNCPSGDPIYASGVVRLTDGVANAPAQRYLVDINSVCSADDGGKCIASANSGFFLANLQEIVSVQQWGTVCNGVTDSTTQFQNAINADTLIPLYVPAGCVVASGLTLQPNTQLACYEDARSILGGLVTGANILLPSTATILRTTNGAGNATIRGCAILRQGAVAATTLRGRIQQAQAFAGTAITCSGVVYGQTLNMDRDVVAGFSTAVSINCDHFNISNSDFDGAYASGTYLINIQSCNDTCSLTNIQASPNVFGAPANGNPQYQQSSITGAINNGSGVCRVSLSSTPATLLVSGDTVTVSNISGATECNGRWNNIVVVNPTTIDLTGSSFSSAYVTGGTLLLSAILRQGTAYNFIEAGGGPWPMNLMAFGFDVDLHFGGTSLSAACEDCWMDGNTIQADPIPIGVLVDGSSARNRYSGFITGPGSGVVINTTYPNANPSLTIVGGSTVGGVLGHASVLSGSLSINSGVAISTLNNISCIAVTDATGFVYDDNSIASCPVSFQTKATDCPKFFQYGSTGVCSYTPVLKGTAASGSPTYSVQDGSYVSTVAGLSKINARVFLSSLGGASGSIQITLPMAAGDSDVQNTNSCTIGRVAATSFSSGYTQFAAQITPGQNVITLSQLVGNGLGTGVQALSSTNVTASSEFAISCSYSVASTIK